MTSQSHMLHLGYMDQGPDLHIIPSIHQRFGIPADPVIRYEMAEHEAQWDFVYPVSAFMDTYKFPVLANDMYEGYPALELDVEAENVEGGRKVVLTMNFVSIHFLLYRSPPDA